MGSNPTPTVDSKGVARDDPSDQDTPEAQFGRHLGARDPELASVVKDLVDCWALTDEHQRAAIRLVLGDPKAASAFMTIVTAGR